MRRTGCKVKRFLVALLAASLILPHGAMCAWAEESALNQTTAIEEAVSSAEEETSEETLAGAEEDEQISEETEADSSEVVLNDIEEETEAVSSEESLTETKEALTGTEETLAETKPDSSEEALTGTEDALTETEAESSETVLNDIEDETEVESSEAVLNNIEDEAEHETEEESSEEVLNDIEEETEGITSEVASSAEPDIDAVANAAAEMEVDAVAKAAAELKNEAVPASAAEVKNEVVEVENDSVPVTHVIINTNARTIQLGKSFQLKAWAQPVNASDRSVTWESSDPSVAEVDETGLVTAIAVGTAEITATTVDGGFTETCVITVPEPVHVTSVIINMTTARCKLECGYQLRAWPQPVNAANRDVIWTSSNPEVCTVNSTGHIWTRTAGESIVTATTVDGGFTAECRIIARNNVTGLDINSTSKVLEIGKSHWLEAFPKPQNATNRNVIWTCSNPKLLKITKHVNAEWTYPLQECYVEAVDPGDPTITYPQEVIVTATTEEGGFKKTCTFQVWKTLSGATVTGVKINTKARTVRVGQTFQMAAWPQPSFAANKKVTWKSSNPSVATISSTGLVKGIKQGTATVTVTTEDGGFTETCKITVAPANVPVTSLVISASEMTIDYLGGCTLRAWPQPTYATNREVIWSSSNPNVATVTSNGTVYSTYEYGTAIITAKTVDGGFTKTCKITVK